MKNINLTAVRFILKAFYDYKSIYNYLKLFNIEFIKAIMYGFMIISSDTLVVTKCFTNGNIDETRFSNLFLIAIIFFKCNRIPRKINRTGHAKWINDYNQICITVLRIQFRIIGARFYGFSSHTKNCIIFTICNI